MGILDSGIRIVSNLKKQYEYGRKMKMRGNMGVFVVFGLGVVRVGYWSGTDWLCCFDQTQRSMYSQLNLDYRLTRPFLRCFNRHTSEDLKYGQAISIPNPVADTSVAWPDQNRSRSFCIPGRPKSQLLSLLMAFGSSAYKVFESRFYAIEIG